MKGLRHRTRCLELRPSDFPEGFGVQYDQAGVVGVLSSPNQSCYDYTVIFILGNVQNFSLPYKQR